VMGGPYEDGYRGPYYTGPYCADAAQAGWVAPPAVR